MAYTKKSKKEYYDSNSTFNFKKSNFHNNSNPYYHAKISPEAVYLGDGEPIIKNNKIIFRNENRIYCFLSTESSDNTNNTNPLLNNPNSIFYAPLTTTNIQITLLTYLIGYYIDLVQKNLIEYDCNFSLHPNKAVNTFIHEMLQSPLEINLGSVPKLGFFYTNGNAILPLYSNSRNITPLNYITLFIINRLERNPGLYFGNNSFITRNPLNFILAGYNINFPYK